MSQDNDDENELKVDSDKLNRIIKKVRAKEAELADSKKHDQFLSFLYVVIAILGTWFVASGIVFKDFPSKAELERLRVTFENRMEQRDREHAATLKEIQTSNLDAIKSIREDQQKSVERLSAGLEDVKLKLERIQAELAMKEKYDGKRP